MLYGLLRFTTEARPVPSRRDPIGKGIPLGKGPLWGRTWRETGITTTVFTKSKREYETGGSYGEHYTPSLTLPSASGEGGEMGGGLTFVFISLPPLLLFVKNCFSPEGAP